MPGRKAARLRQLGQSGALTQTFARPIEPPQHAEPIGADAEGLAEWLGDALIARLFNVVMGGALAVSVAIILW